MAADLTLESWAHGIRVEDMLLHVGHKIAMVTYGRGEPVNVSLECEDCDIVLTDKDL